MSSRRDQKDALRAERVAREQEQQAAERRKRLVGYGLAGALALAVVVAIVVVLASGDEGGSAGDLPEASSIPAVETADLAPAADAAGCKLTEDEDEGSDHVEGSVEYQANPPTSGNHNPVPAEDGAYSTAPQLEQLVHSQEHGRIVIQYRPDVPEAVKSQLKALFDEDPYHTILTPNETDMPFEVAATTWTQTLGCPEMNDQVFDAIRAFHDDFVDQGPEFVP